MNTDTTITGLYANRGIVGRPMGFPDEFGARMREITRSARDQPAPLGIPAHLIGEPTSCNYAAANLADGRPSR